MHGGAAGSGAPVGNRNAWKTGYWTREAKAERLRLKSLLQEGRALVRALARDLGRDPDERG